MRPLAQCPEQPTIVFSASNCNTKEIAAQFCKTVACADENFPAQEKRAELQGIAAALLYLVGALGIGLFISTIVETQQQAMFVTLFIVMIYLLMSGLFTPVRSMPNWAQWMAEVNPVKHFIELVRAVLIKGATVGEVRREIVGLAAIGVAALALAVRQYGRTAG